ncbi:MAG: aminotransferase class IV [Patescibacteria group bacterium]
MAEIKYCYLNGKIIPLNEAHINPNDMGILRGYAIFDFLRTYNEKPFLLKEHWNRLQKSAKELNLKIPHSESTIKKIIKTLLIKNKMNEAGIRIIITGGITEDSMNLGLAPTMLILMEKLKKLPENIYLNGAKIITFEHQRDVPLAKTTDYLMAVKLQPFRKQNKAIEILYTKNDLILECTTSNFFIFKKNTLITPKNNVLMGTTRNFVIKLAKKAKFSIEERDLPTDELKSANEAFITATTKEIAPIIQVNDQKIGNGKVGKNTKILMELFLKNTLNY